MNENFTRIAEVYKRQIGEVTYIISAFANANARFTADEMIIQMLENRILNKSGKENFSDGEYGKRVIAGETQT